MSTDYQRIYAERASEYDELIRAEDVDANLPALLGELAPIDGATVVDIGAGTGRITRLLHARAKRVIAVDQAAAMIEFARASLAHAPHVTFFVADAAALPVPNATADLCVAAWCFGHTRRWHPDDWRSRIAGYLAEMRRVSKPGAIEVVIETLGTGSAAPAPPSEHLAEYYALLEGTHGFARRTIRTDYAFASVDEAARVTGFFFGDGFAARVRDSRWARVPEWTGVWWRKADEITA